MVGFRSVGLLVFFFAAGAGCGEGGLGFVPPDGGPRDLGDDFDVPPPFDSGDRLDAGEPDADLGDAQVTDRADAGTSTSVTPHLNDVSILWPLPRAADARSDFLWLTPGTNEVGPYFPGHRRNELPDPIADVPFEPGSLEVVVALRYDPCARSSAAAPCQAQLRLVAQPVVFDGTGSNDATMLDDTALHLFYALDDQESAAVLAELRALTQTTTVSTAGPLGVHPVMAAEGPKGTFATGLRALVLRHCNAANLVRITANTFAFDNWAFSRFDWNNDHFEQQALVGMTQPSDTQGWLRRAQRDDLDDPAGGIDPPPLLDFSYLLSRDVYQNLDPVQTAEAVAMMTAIENPTVTLADESDCVSCHIGAQLSLYARRRGVDFSNAPEPYVPPAGINTELELEPSVRGNLGNTIMFGYHGERSGKPIPSISRRVIFETAEVLKALEAN